MPPDAGPTGPVPGLAEALQQVAQLGHLCATLQGQVAQLEATKSDRAELQELRLLLPEGGESLEGGARALKVVGGHPGGLRGWEPEGSGRAGSTGVNWGGGGGEGGGGGPGGWGCQRARSP